MRKSTLLPLLALLGGGAGFALRLWQNASAFREETMLYRNGAPATVALLALLALLAVLFLVLVQGGRRAEDYPRAFACPGAGYMTLMTAGSFLLLAAAALGALELRTLLQLWQMGRLYIVPVMPALTVVLCLPAGVAGLILGKGNYRASLPRSYPLLTTLPAYLILAWIVAIYQDVSSDPEVMLFVMRLLGALLSALAFYYAAGFAFRRPYVRRCLFFSAAAVVMQLTALADRPSLHHTVLALGVVLLLLAQIHALARNCFGSDPKEPAVKGF